MNKTSMLAAIALATLSGCALQPTTLTFNSQPTNSSVKVNTAYLGNTLTITLDSLTSVPYSYHYYIGEDMARYVESMIDTEVAVSVDVLAMDIDAYGGMSKTDSICRVAYSVNGQGKAILYQYAYTFDSFTVGIDELGYNLVTPCLDRLSHDIKVYADSL